MANPGEAASAREMIGMRGLGQTTAIIAGVWAVLLIGGYPLPMIDDLFFSGAAIHMAQGGTFSNPYCPGIAMLGARDHFFVYMPFQSYFLRAWLDVFGISRVALASLQCLLGLVASGALLDFIGPARDKGRQAIYALAVALSIALFASAMGFRPDLLGVCLFAIGLRLLKAGSVVAVFVCALFLMFAILTSPTVGLLSPLVVLYALFFSPAHPIDSRIFYLRLGAVIAAGLVAALAFLAMIGFQLHDFLSIFNNARQAATFYIPLSSYFGDRWAALKLIFGTVSLMLITLAIPIAAGLALRRFERPVSRGAIGFFLVAALAVCLAERTSAAGIYLLVLTCLVLFLYFCVRLHSRFEGPGLAVFAALFFLVLLLHGRMLFQLAFVPLTRHIDQVPDIRAQLEQLHPAHIYVDSAAAAELYDYRLPANAYDCFFGVEGLWRRYPRARDLPPDSVVIISSRTAVEFDYLLMAEDPSEYHFQPIPFIHRFYTILPADPYALYLIPVRPASP